MINVTDIRDNLYGVVGFREPIDPDYQILSSENKGSTSGKYFQDYSAYLSVRNIKELQPYPDISSADLNDWLADEIKGAVVRVCQRVFENNDLIENLLVYDYSNVKTDLLENAGDFVGFEIMVSRRKDIKAIINQVVTEFSGTGNVELLLFHDGYSAPLKTQTITVANTDFLSTDLGWDLPYSNSVKGGKFYLGYLTDGLDVQAINREWNMANAKNVFKHVGINPIRVGGWDQETLFDIDDIDYESDTYGLNFDISVYKDYTDLILKNKSKFADVIGYEFAIQMISMMISSPRTNKDERINKASLMMELEGTVATENLPTTASGIQKRQEQKIKDLREIFFGEPKIRKLTLK